MLDLGSRAPPEAFAAVRFDHACFGCGDDNPTGLHLKFASNGDGVSAPFTPAPEHQGFANVVHGGIITTVLDEAMAWATASAGVWGVTGEMRVRFKTPLAVGELTTATARITEQRGKIVTTVGELARDGDGAMIATATATFLRVSDERAAEWRSRYLAPGDAAAGAGSEGTADSEVRRNPPVTSPGTPTPKPSPLDETIQRTLLSRAREIADNAYVPYSNFPVGAAAVTADGSIFAGVNVENASYGLTICAERSVVTALVSAGHRDIVAIAVSAPRVPLTTPCGACRQVLNEFRPVSEDMLVVLDDRDAGRPVRLGELLPMAFGPRNLEDEGEQTIE